jgi:hypothetical protein
MGHRAHIVEGSNRPGAVYQHRLLRCAGCGRGGLAYIKYEERAGWLTGELIGFFPRTVDVVPVPVGVPEGIVSELREAELCASAGAWKAASALIRSVLEKTLKENGYTEGSLQRKIDLAATDGVITAPRAKKAHEDLRVLGNDVLHDEWREVKEEEVEAAHHYAQRILADLYDDRPAVEAILIEKGRIAAG